MRGRRCPVAAKIGGSGAVRPVAEWRGMSQCPHSGGGARMSMRTTLARLPRAQDRLRTMGPQVETRIEMHGGQVPSRPGIRPGSTRPTTNTLGFVPEQTGASFARVPLFDPKKFSQVLFPQQPAAGLGTSKSTCVRFRSLLHIWSHFGTLSPRLATSVFRFVTFA